MGDTMEQVQEAGLEAATPEAKEIGVGMNFGLALDYLKSNNNRLARKGWNGKGMWIELQIPTELSKMTLPYIYMKTADDNLVPWLASQTDLLAEDWEVVA